MDDQAKRDLLKRICYELGVGPGEALRYLKAFNWDLKSAMEACRNKTLPSLGDISSPVKEKSATEAPSTPPSMINPSPISNPPEQQSSQWRNQRIVEFCEWAVGATVEEAKHFLRFRDWDVNLAVDDFMVERRPTPSQRKSNSPLVSQDYPLANWNWDSHRKRSTIGRSNSQLFSEDETSAAATLMGLPPLSELYDVKIESSPSGLMDVDLTVEDGEEHIDVATSKMVPSLQNIQNIHESRISNLPNLPEPSSELINEVNIHLFREAAGGATREEAISYLKHCNWDLEQAFNCFIHRFSEKEIYAAIMNIDLESMRLPPLPRFQASHGITLKDGEIGSSPSSTNADPTETGRSQEAGEEHIDVASPQMMSFLQNVIQNVETGRSQEAVEESVTVNIPGIASSQVDAIDEDLSKKTFPGGFVVQGGKIVGPQSALIDTIPLTVLVADGMSGKSIAFPFKPDATVRDIREAVENVRSANNRDYDLMSSQGQVYRDLNMTVERIVSGGTTKLIQVYTD